MQRAATGWLRGAASSLRWRVETYSGKRAETLTTRDMHGFCLELALGAAGFLAWIGRLDREVHKRA